MMRNVKNKMAAIIAVVCAIAFPANSHDGKGHGHATGVVRERMELMEAIGQRMKSINSRVKTRQKLVAIKDDARAIGASAAHIAHLFPPGSAQSPTQARATIWQNFPDFERLAKALETEAIKLAEMNIADLGTLSTQVRAVSETCSKCHETYRVKR